MSDDEVYSEADGESLSERLDELEGRIGQLEGNGRGYDNGGVVIYTLGAALGMVLSWSRNASILWCILHGVCSWFYVVYFTVTR